MKALTLKHSHKPPALPVAAGRPRPRCNVAVFARLVLIPAGDGKTEHLNAVPSSLDSIVPIDVSVPGVFEVGRVDTADVALPFPTVSGRHAMLAIEEGIVKVTDLGSTNGTYVNGQQLKELQTAVLSVNDVVVFGDPHLATYQLQDVDYTSSSDA